MLALAPGARLPQCGATVGGMRTSKAIRKSKRLLADLDLPSAEAIGELGDPAPWIGAKESEVRDFAHDGLRPHHDKDYRLYHAF